MKKTIAETQKLLMEQNAKRRGASSYISFDHTLSLNQKKRKKLNKSNFRSWCRIAFFQSQVSLFVVDYEYVIPVSYEFIGKVDKKEDGVSHWTTDQTKQKCY